MGINNYITLRGFAAIKPVLYKSKKGTPVTSVPLYENDQVHRCVFIGQMAQKAHERLKKGSHFTVIGRLRYKCYTNTHGHKVKVAEVLVEDFACSPRQNNIDCLKDTLREIIRENNITSEEELKILQDE